MNVHGPAIGYGADDRQSIRADESFYELPVIDNDQVHWAELLGHETEPVGTACPSSSDRQAALDRSSRFWRCQ